MKAIVTFIDDDGNVIQSNKLIPPMRTKYDGIADIYEFSFVFAAAREKSISFNYLAEKGERDEITEHYKKLGEYYNGKDRGEQP